MFTNVIVDAPVGVARIAMPVMMTFCAPNRADEEEVVVVPPCPFVGNCATVEAEKSNTIHRDGGYGVSGTGMTTDP